VETGRVINRRYLLQRLIQQGQVCAVYQGVDQLLQRVVAVKIVPASYVLPYRAAIQMTSHFSHPNIIGLYDLIADPGTLYLVQEYVEGDDFAALLQSQLTPYEVADIGCQICQALLYAGSSSRKVSHGDLTPQAVIRDRTGRIRVNNFALPSDLDYFEKWSIVGGDGIAISDDELPWGQQSEGRQENDTRAVGLLLYQLLTGRPAGGSTVGARFIAPPADGRLRFLRTVPPELCETVARAVMRQHPQHFTTIEALYAELSTLAEVLEAASPVPLVASASAASTASAYVGEEVAPPQQFSPSGAGMSAGVGASIGAGKPISTLPVRDTERPAQGFPPYRPEQGLILPAVEPAPAAPTIADIPMNLAAARQAAYGEPVSRSRRSRILLLLLMCLVAFALFFVIGYFAGHLLLP
jgi:serine/threonine protein kinase